MIASSLSLHDAVDDSISEVDGSGSRRSWVGARSVSVESVGIGDHFLSTVLILSAELEPHCCLSRLELLVPDTVAPTLSLHTMQWMTASAG